VKKVMVAFYFGVTTRKKVTTMSHNLLMWFHCSKEEGDDIFYHLFQWLCCNKMATCTFLWFCYKGGDGSNVVTFLYGGGVVEKDGGDFFLFFVVFWFSSLELIINNEMVVLFFVEGWTG